MPTLLIVDDEKENLDALTLALGDENKTWKIKTASSAQQALEILTEQSKQNEPIDVLLTDLVMESEQSGMDMLRNARRIDPMLMTILFTAKEKSLDRYQALELGAFDVVEKNIRGSMAVTEINLKTRAALHYREWSKEINFLRRYFDKRLFETIVSNPSVLEMRSKVITIAFWDIRGFSRLCEILKAQPNLISGFLKDYCESAARCIFQNNGILDKFIGDGVMALFGVLEESGQEDLAAKSAVQTGIDFAREFQKLLEKWVPLWQKYVPDKIEIGLGCGIHTAETLVGNVGTDCSDQFTALGPAVNLASRIESRSLANEILISQSTYIRTNKDFAADKHAEINDIKNIPGTFEIYRIKH